MSRLPVPISSKLRTMRKSRLHVLTTRITELIGYYRAEQIIPDTSPFIEDDVAGNIMSWTPAFGEPTVVPGKLNNGLSFPGLLGLGFHHFVIPYLPGANTDDPEFTVRVWIRIPQAWVHSVELPSFWLGTGAELVGMFAHAPGGLDTFTLRMVQYFDFGLGKTIEDPKVQMFLGDTNSVTSPETVDDGNWHRLVAMYDGSEISLRIDNNPPVTATYSGIGNAGSGLIWWNSTHQLAIEQDELGIWSGDWSEGDFDYDWNGGAGRTWPDVLNIGNI